MAAKRKQSISAKSAPDQDTEPPKKKRGRPAGTTTRAAKAAKATTGSGTAQKNQATGKTAAKQGEKSGETVSRSKKAGASATVTKATTARAKKTKKEPVQEEEDGSVFFPVYEENGVEEEDELSEDSEIMDMPEIPATSLPVSLRLRVSSAKPTLLLQGPGMGLSTTESTGAKPFSKLGGLPVVISESESELEPLPPRVKTKITSKKVSHKKQVALEIESEDEDSDEPEDEDLSITQLRIGLEQDGATEHFSLPPDVDYEVFRCHVATKLGQLPDDLRIAYRTADMPKSERHHLRTPLHFEEMINTVLGWIDTKLDEVREARRELNSGGKRGKKKGKGKEPVALQKAMAQLKGLVVTIVDLSEKKRSGKQASKIESIESPAVKFARHESEIRARCCVVCGESCVVVHVPGKGPEHRKLKDEVIQLWANLATKNMASTKGDPPPQVITRMSDARFATQSGRHKREKSKSPPVPQSPKHQLPTPPVTTAPTAPPTIPATPQSYASMGMAPMFFPNFSPMPSFPTPTPCAHTMPFGYPMPAQPLFSYGQSNPGYTMSGIPWGYPMPPNMQPPNTQPTNFPSASHNPHM